MKIGDKEFDFTAHTYVMGILNVTPDSFSDGGKWNSMDAALKHAQQMVQDGAAIIDVGGESTRPGYTMVTEDEEIARTVPLIERLKHEFSVPVSIDTYKSRVAEAAIHAGADLVNDIWGLKYDGKMAKVIADTGVSCCLAHNRNEPSYQELLPDMKADFKEILEIAHKAGIFENQILLDPGIGFGKTYEQNIEALGGLGQFHSLGYPMLLGASRKSVIGLALGLPIEERLEGTLVTTVLAVYEKYGIVRVHDVKENVRAIRMAEAVLHHSM